MDLFENRNKKLDIPHLSTAKYVQFALSIQYFSYIVDYVCSILQQNHLHIHISQFTTHKQRCTRGYKRYKETSGLIEWKECQIFHSIFT